MAKRRKLRKGGWTPAESAEAIKLFRQGTKTKEIAQILNARGYGHTWNEVRLHLWHEYEDDCRAAYQARRREKSNVREEALKLGRKGMGVDEISDALKISRHQVYAYVPVDMRFDMRSLNFEKWLSNIRPSRPVVIDKITTEGFELIDLAPNQCHWPIGVSEGGAHRFCGCLRIDGPKTAYCASHAAMARRPPAEEPPKQAGPNIVPANDDQNVARSLAA